jgi:two-component system cell cycle sensor histidine kinase/response regulator CckA
MDQIRILVVEDENIVALDIKMHLQKNGYFVPGVFASGEAAIANIEKLKPDLVIMDIKLQGGMDGLEASTFIKSHYRLPVILLTAFADEATIERAKITEPFGYIIKPFEERELRTAITIALYRHKMELKLREREALFSALFNSIAEGILVLDEENRIEFLNPAAVGISGRNAADCLHAPIQAIFPFIDIQDGSGQDDVVDEPISYARQTGGRLFYIEKTASPLLDDSGARKGTVVILHDITTRVETERALRQSEDQLRHSQKMEAIGRLAGGIAHDFNNLLTVIMGYTRLMLDDESSNPELRSNIEGIQQAVLRSVSLTRQLLVFSRHQMLEFKNVDINFLVSDMEKMIRRLVSEDTSINLALDASHPEIYVDRGQIEQVLINLAVNARDAMIDGGTLFIKTGNVRVEQGFLSVMGAVQPGSYVTLSVRDTGTGIKGDQLGKIFDPFFTTKETGRGTGLGLSLAYGIIQQSGGYITVASEENRGSTFTLYLPHSTKNGVVEDPITQKKEAFGGTETILLVEDEENIRKLIGRVLSQKGYHVLEAQNAGEALLINEEFQGQIPLLITDVIMPYVSGPKLCRRLRAIRADMKVLFISGYPYKVLQERQLISDQDNFVQKPFDLDKFAQSIRRVLDI